MVIASFIGLISYSSLKNLIITFFFRMFSTYLAVFPEVSAFNRSWFVFLPTSLAICRASAFFFDVTSFKAIITDYGVSASGHGSFFAYMSSAHLIALRFVG